MLQLSLVSLPQFDRYCSTSTFLESTHSLRRNTEILLSADFTSVSMLRGSVSSWCSAGIQWITLSCLNCHSFKSSESRPWHWRSCIKAGPCSSSGPPSSAPLCDARPQLKHTPLSGASAMDMSWFLCVCVFLVVGLTLLALQLKLRRSAHGPQEPPHLPALPLIGSLLSLRSPHPPHVLFKELQKKYGQTYSLMMGSHCVIIVNQHTHAKEVLLKKGKIFAGRPRTVGTPLLHSSSSSSSS